MQADARNLSWSGYFRRPFPPAEGFSAYRSPGMSVHLPVLAMVSGLGVICSGPVVWLWPLLPVYVVAGLYLGRDLAVQAHYNLLITLAVWLAAGGLIIVGPRYAPRIEPLWEQLGWQLALLDVPLACLAIWLLRRQALRWAEG